MASSAVEIVAPLAFVIVLELARIARDIPLVDTGGGTELLDYGTPSKISNRILAWVAKRTGFSSRVAPVGGFQVVFTITELVLYGSVLLVYATAGPFSNRTATELGIAPGVVLFLLLMWIVLPVVVVDRYDDLARDGFRPLSMDVHATTTAIYFGFVVALFEVEPVLSGVEPDTIREAQSFLVSVTVPLITLKSATYRRYLRQELEYLDAETDRTDEGDRADGTDRADGEGASADPTDDDS